MDDRLDDILLIKGPTGPTRFDTVHGVRMTCAVKRLCAAGVVVPGPLQIVAVGDATKITDILRKKGELQIYDADGNPMK